MSSKKPRSTIPELLGSCAFVFSLSMLFMINGLSDSYSERKKLRATIDSFQTEHESLERRFADIKKKARSTDPRVIWLARAIYSETRRKREMELVGWVIRNRVEKEFRNDKTYRDVILSSYQFSAFNPRSKLRFYYATLPYSHKERKENWNMALRVAKDVVFAEHHEMPKYLTEDTFWFYSEVSMPPDKPHPQWRYEYERVEVPFVNEERFRFFRDPNRARIAAEPIKRNKNTHTSTLR